MADVPCVSSNCTWLGSNGSYMTDLKETDYDNGLLLELPKYIHYGKGYESINCNW